MTQIKAIQQLHSMAQERQGFFTTRQAMKAGYSAKNHAYHVKTGEWIREYRGIYRLAQIPSTDEAELVLWSLWSGNRKGEPQGVYSHQTALRIHNLSDVSPSKIHMTVPPHFRRNAEIPKVLILHRNQLTPDDIEDRKGYRVTKPMRAILDLIDADSVPESILTQSLEEGIRRGIINLAEARSPGVPDILKKLANKIARGFRS
jgi:predicted transcriptional regulator of viral defense system